MFANLDFARNFPPAKIISTANGISRNFPPAKFSSREQRKGGYDDETGKRFSREDIFAGRYFRVNSIFAKISSRENISNSFFAKFSSRENKVLYSITGKRRQQHGNNCTGKLKRRSAKGSEGCGEFLILSNERAKYIGLIHALPDYISYKSDVIGRYTRIFHSTCNIKTFSTKISLIVLDMSCTSS